VLDALIHLIPESALDELRWALEEEVVDLGSALAPYLDDVARSVSHLVFSLDTMDPAKADAWLGRGAGRQAEILATIEVARRYPQRRYEIIISSVATPDNLPDLRDVFRYAAERGFRHAVCPVLRGVTPDSALAGDPHYRELLDFLTARRPIVRPNPENPAPW